MKISNQYYDLNKLIDALSVIESALNIQFNIQFNHNNKKQRSGVNHTKHSYASTFTIEENINRAIKDIFWNSKNKSRKKK